MGSVQVYWGDGTSTLVIRSGWEQFRDAIFNCRPTYVILTGKSGRGISVYLRYLIFYILLVAKKASNTVDKKASAQSTDTANSNEDAAHVSLNTYGGECHVTDPRIAYMDSTGKLYLITKDSVTPVANIYELLAADGARPHYYFSDNADINTDIRGTLVTIAACSGDIDTLKHFTNRFSEAWNKTRLNLIMPGLELVEMLGVFGGFAVEDVTFKYDVVGGNPRLAFSHCLGDENSSHFALVRDIVEIMFRAQDPHLKLWAVDLVSSVLDKALKGKARDALDSGIFCDCQIESIFSGLYSQVFSPPGFSALLPARSTMPATKLSEPICCTCSVRGVIREGCGSIVHSWLCWALVPPRCTTGQVVALCLGGGSIKLIRKIEDLAQLKEREHGVPTVSNYDIDGVLCRGNQKFCYQFTNAKKIEGELLAKLEVMLGALRSTTESEVSIIFVVPHENISEFTFPTGLQGVQQYLTTPHPCSKDVVNREARKRKRDKNN